RLHRLGARNLACGVASHPVGDDVESERIVGEEGVLVVLALLAHVGAGPTADDGHSSSRLRIEKVRRKSPVRKSTQRVAPVLLHAARQRRKAPENGGIAVSPFVADPSVPW